MRKSTFHPATLPTAHAQLSLVEHALCPLDASVSLQPGSIFHTHYFFTDQNRNRRVAQVRVGALDGLSANDELYLWGLLSLTLSQAETTSEFFATPYYCLRQLGIISATKRGGTEFEQFRAALRRLAGVRYFNERFYDPLRGEHREVSFGLLSYSLPIDLRSQRAWRIVWDPLFLEFSRAGSGALRFNLPRYRQLNCATRRLYLFLQKVFWRQDVSPELDVRHVAVHVLGFSEKLPVRTLKGKLQTVIRQLLATEALMLPLGTDEIAQLFTKRGVGEYSVRLHRGPKFHAEADEEKRARLESPVVEPLRAIGLDWPTIHRVLASFPHHHVEQWADITIAARERHGDSFFSKSPAAYFLDNLKAAAASQRTPPDWWHELCKQERWQVEEQQRQRNSAFTSEKEEQTFETYLRQDGRKLFQEVTQRLFAELRSAGKDEAQAHDLAERLARGHMQNRFRARDENSTH